MTVPAWRRAPPRGAARGRSGSGGGRSRRGPAPRRRCAEPWGRGAGGCDRCRPRSSHHGLFRTGVPFPLYSGKGTPVPFLFGVGPVMLGCSCGVIGIDVDLQKGKGGLGGG